ncbi:MAG: DUF3352 domain-containing protein [Bacteroidales bacterium]|nr:DUF3352 domain-containing protein [Bacteroidales bacterium]
MKKILQFLAVLIVIAVISGIIYLFVLSPGEKFQSVYLVPHDAAYIIETEDPFGAWDKIIHSNAWAYLKTNNLLSEIDRDIQGADSLVASNRLLIKLFGNRKILISSHRYKPGRYEFLFVVDLKSVSKLKNMKSYLGRVTGDGYRLTQRTYKEYEISELFDKKSGDLYYFALIKNQLIFSEVYTLLEASIDQLENLTLGRDLNFIEVTRHTEGKGLFSICINYRYFKDYIAGIMGKPNDFLEMLSDNLYYTSAYVQLDDKGMLKLTGYTSVKDTTKSFLRALMNSGHGGHGFSGYSPSRTATFVNIGCEKALNLYKNIKNTLDDASLANLESAIGKTEKMLKINIERDILGWMEDEISLIQTQPSNLGRMNEFAVAFRAGSNKQATESLSYLATQVKKNSPVKFKEISYKGYKINYLHIPGIFKMIFGNLIKRLEKPYYTIIDKYVIFSNHPQTLKSIIDDLETGTVLFSEQGRKDFMSHFSDRSMLMAYFQVPVLFSNLREFVSPQTWSDMQKNKRYFVCFPNIGLSAQTDKELIKLELLAEFNPQPDEFTPVKYLFDPVSFMLQDTSVYAPANNENKKDDFEPVINISDLDASKYEEFFDNGNLKISVELKNGLKHGNFREYYEDGNVKLRGKYKQDMMDGTWKLYNEEGNLLETREYKDGVAE